MKKSEKLLDAIGQIDDRLVEEAAKSGRMDGMAAAEETDGDSKQGLQADEKKGVRADAAGKNAGGRKKALRGKKKNKSGYKIYRWRGAVAACAVLAICVGVLGLLNREGLLLGPFGFGSSSNKEAAADTALSGAMDSGAAWDAASADSAAADLPAENAEAPAEGVQTASDQTAGSPDAMEAQPEGHAAEEAAPEEEAAAAEQQKTGREADKSAQDAKTGTGLEAAMSEEADSSVEEKNAEALCELSERTQQSGQESTATTEEASTIVVSVKESSAAGVTFEVENHGERAILFGREFELEQLVNGSWQTVAPKDEADWDAVGIELGTGDAYEETVVLDSFYGKLPAGQYRLVKSYMLAAEKEPQGLEKYPMYVEFTVSK